jgi:hypothetical protein
MSPWRLVPRLFWSTLGAGWTLSLGCFLLFTQINGGHLPLFLLWLAIGFARWSYTFVANKAAFAYLHNLIHSNARLWAIISAFELLPWLIALTLNVWSYAFGN